MHVVYSELHNLAERAVAFNFSHKEGVMLYRQMRNWLRLDILNERSGVELFMTFVVPLSFGCICICWSQYLLNAGEVGKSVSMVFWPAVAFVLATNVSRALAQCVKANEYLFTWPSKLLFEWQDYAVTGEGGFPCRNEPGWIWDTSAHCARPLALYEAPTHLRVSGTDDCNGVYVWVANLNDRPVYEHLMRHVDRIIFYANEGWIMAVGTRVSLHNVTQSDWLLLGKALDSQNPPADGWSAVEPQRGQCIMRPSTAQIEEYNLNIESKDEMADLNLSRVDRILANTIHGINVLQDKQTLFGVPVTSQLQHSMLLTLASLAVPLLKEGYHIVTKKFAHDL